MDFPKAEFMEDMETLLAELSNVQEDISQIISKDTTVISVKAGSKIERLLKFATSKMQDPAINEIVWTGESKAISKVISCAEIMKRNIQNLHQVTNIFSIKSDKSSETSQVKSKAKDKVRSAISIFLSKRAIKDIPRQEHGNLEYFDNEISEKKLVKRKRKDKVMETSKKRRVK